MRRILELKKIDLHRHLTGSITAQTAVKLAAKYDIELPTYIAAELDKILFSKERVEDHHEYFVPWPILNRLFSSLDAVKDIIFSVVEAAAADNVVYSELRLGPRGFLGESSSYSFDEFVEVVANSLKEADQKFSTTTRCILGIPRHVFIKVPESSRAKMFARMLASISQSVDCFVGVDLNGDELAAAGSDFASFFSLAESLGFPATVHAGEVGPAHNVDVAVRTLSASRIGHGIAVAQNKEVMSMVSERGVVLEICPTSNQLLGVITEIKSLPLQILKQQKVKFAICTDNPARCRTSMSEELFKVAKAFSMSFSEVASLVRESASAAFADSKTRANVLKQINY